MLSNIGNFLLFLNVFLSFLVIFYSFQNLKTSQKKTKKDYSKNPLVGITEALSFLNPFSDSFIYETKFIKLI